MKIVRRNAYRRVLWRNGLGETEEIAVQSGTDSDGPFDWRISMAPVVADGAFSEFPGIDRILTVIDGDGLRLTWPQDAGGEQVCLPGRPAAFSGDTACQAELLNGPIVDLNVMTRRGGWRAEVRPLTRYKRRPVTRHHLIFAMDGPLDGTAAGEAFSLLDKETLWLTDPFPEPVILTGRWLDIQLYPDSTGT